MHRHCILLSLLALGVQSQMTITTPTTIEPVPDPPNEPIEPLTAENFEQILLNMAAQDIEMERLYQAAKLQIYMDKSNLTSVDDLTEDHVRQSFLDLLPGYNLSEAEKNYVKKVAEMEFKYLKNSDHHEYVKIMVESFKYLQNAATDDGIARVRGILERNNNYDLTVRIPGALNTVLEKDPQKCTSYVREQLHINCTPQVKN